MKFNDVNLSVADAVRTSGASAQEYVDAMLKFAEANRAHMLEHYPECFDANDKLRRDWLLIMYGDALPWWRRWWLRFVLWL